MVSPMPVFPSLLFHIKKSYFCKVFQQIFSIIFLLFSFSALNILAQEPPSPPKGGDSIAIRKIYIENNRKTKDYIIFRELTVKENQKIKASQLDSIILANRLQVFNLLIFNDVNFNITNWDNDSLDLHIKVFEKWTLIPMPIIKLADRNINEWWRQYHHDFSRIQYGIRFNWANFTGRNDVLSFAASFGLAHMFELGYMNPTINKKRTFGYGALFSYQRSRRIPVNTINDKLSFIDLNNFFHYNHFLLSNSFIVRPNFRITHHVKASYSYSMVSDSVIRANPDYYINEKSHQNYFMLGYYFENDHRDIKAYPSNGWLIQTGISNYGLGLMPDINLTTAYFRMSGYRQWQKHRRFSAAGFGKILLSFPRNQPYNIQEEKALGYNEDLVRGYELYVLNGKHYLLFKSEQRFKAVDFKIKNIKKIQSKPIMNKSIAYLPINIVVKTFFDAGYVWDNQFEKTNSLKNKWIFGFGAGIDLVTFNNSVFRVEYSFNRNLENRLYLHFQQAL
jgi:outer membrane protein assembly factor BamA